MARGAATQAGFRRKAWRSIARAMAPAETHAQALRCGLSDAVEAIGERWSFLILRGAFNGLSHFEEFQRTLGIARNILANRLARLVERGILVREPSADDRRRVHYRLTPRGEDLLPVLVALREWGERWGSSGDLGPVLVDAVSGLPMQRLCVQSAKGEPLAWDQLNRAEPSD